MKRITIFVFLAVLLFSLSLPIYTATQNSNPLKNTLSISANEKIEGEKAKENEKGNDEELLLGEKLPLWSAIPFAGILLSIAIFPLVAPEFWHHHFGKVSAFWGLSFFIPFFIFFRHEAIHETLHIIFLDYIPFIILLWALYTVSGGILVKGTLKGTPPVNLLIILIGTFLSSWIGTTGSAMLLIRPIIRANKHRKHKTHIIVFFIFLVANIGGSLTPLGDPPLFLGFLHGVPFFWTFNLIKEMGFVSIILLLLFFIIDTYYYKKESEESLTNMDSVEKEPLKIVGLHNIIFLLGIIGGVLLSGFWHPGKVNILSVHVEIENIVRNVILVIMGLLSLWTTKKSIREENEFTWFPIKEVAILFAGIFVTIIPAIAILKAGDKGSLAWLMKTVKDPEHYFWATGILSSFLDNAPTYLTFLNSALGQLIYSHTPGITEVQAIHNMIANHPQYLVAISIGAVFMGANTYIGNAPNFMVKSIAEEYKIEMPSFFGYMIKYSIPILVSTFIIVTIVFF